VHRKPAAGGALRCRAGLRGHYSRTVADDDGEEHREPARESVREEERLAKAGEYDGAHAGERLLDGAQPEQRQANTDAKCAYRNRAALKICLREFALPHLGSISARRARSP